MIVTAWLQTAPLVQTEVLPSWASCQSAARAVAHGIGEQARSNLMAPHQPLILVEDAAAGVWLLKTAVLEREVARVQCSKLP